MEAKIKYEYNVEEIEKSVRDILEGEVYFEYKTKPETVEYFEYEGELLETVFNRRTDLYIIYKKPWLKFEKLCEINRIDGITVDFVYNTDFYRKQECEKHYLLIDCELDDKRVIEKLQ